MNPVILHSYKPVNPGGAPLCTEKLRTFSGFESCPEDEAKAIVETLIAFAGILVRNVNKYSHSQQGQEMRLEPSLQQGKAA